MDESTDEPSETEMLKERYARGEIDDATYQEMMEYLTDDDDAEDAEEDDFDADDAEDAEDADADKVGASSEYRKRALKQSTPWSSTPPGIPPGMF